MASRLNFGIGSPVDPTQALQVSLGNIGKYFADYQDRELRREEKEVQQKRWEAENTRAEATHKMQLDEYNRKVAERDALSSVFKDPSRMEAIVNQGVYSTPDALRISNEVADVGSAINRDMETITAPVKARLAKDATSGIFDSSNTFDATDTVESRMGSTRDILDRMGTTKDRSVVSEDTAYRAGGAQKAADMFAQEMLNSGSADSNTRFKDAVVGNMSKGQVRDMYMQGLLSQGVGLDNAMTLAKMYSDDLVTPAERRKSLLEEVKVKNDIAATAAKIGDRTGSVVNVGGRGVDGEPLEDTGQPKNLVGVLKSYNDQAKAAGTKWNTNWLSTDSYTKLNDFVNSVREHPDLKNQPEYVKAAMANAAIARTFNPHDWTGDADFGLSGTKDEFNRLLAEGAKDPNSLKDVVDSWGQVPKAEKSRLGGSRNKASEEFALTQLQDANALLNSKSGAPKSASDVWTNLRRLTTEGPYNETRLTEFGKAMDAAKGIGGPSQTRTTSLAADNAEYDSFAKRLEDESKEVTEENGRVMVGNNVYTKEQLELAAQKVKDSRLPSNNEKETALIEAFGRDYKISTEYKDYLAGRGQLLSNMDLNSEYAPYYMSRESVLRKVLPSAIAGATKRINDPENSVEELADGVYRKGLIRTKNPKAADLARLNFIKSYVNEDVGKRDRLEALLNSLEAE